MDTTPSTPGYSHCMNSPVISKSRYMAGLQCPRLLWHKFNQPDAFPPVDAATQAIFDQGAQVGELAKQLFPKGLEIGAGVIKKDAVDELSRAAITFGKASAAERRKVRTALEKYCGLDTEGMVWIVEALDRLV